MLNWVDGVVRQANVSDVEVDELGAVVVTCPEGDREVDLPNRDRGAVSDSGERLGWLKTRVRDLYLVEGGDGDDTKTRSSVHEGLAEPEALYPRSHDQGDSSGALAPRWLVLATPGDALL